VRRGQLRPVSLLKLLKGESVKYILILLVYLNGYPASQAITTAEFNGKSACVAAGEKAKELKSPFYGDIKTQYICVEGEARKIMVLSIDQNGKVQKGK
jgi:hypothetical protein